MVRTKTPAEAVDTPETTSETTDVATTDDRNWMLDLFDWPMFFGRGRLGSLLDPEHVFGGRFEDGLPMRVEQYTDDDGLVVRAELPGLDPESDIEIGIEGRRLTIDATREERTESTDDGRRSEFRYGKFHRSMVLPAGADAEGVAATYVDGILEVRVPIRREAETATRVPVTRG